MQFQKLLKLPVAILAALIGIHMNNAVAAAQKPAPGIQHSDNEGDCPHSGFIIRRFNEIMNRMPENSGYRGYGINAFQFFTQFFPRKADSPEFQKSLLPIRDAAVRHPVAPPEIMPSDKSNAFKIHIRTGGDEFLPGVHVIIIGIVEQLQVRFQGNLLILAGNRLHSQFLSDEILNGTGDLIEADTSDTECHKELHKGFPVSIAGAEKQIPVRKQIAGSCLMTEEVQPVQAFAVISFLKVREIIVPVIFVSAQSLRKIALHGNLVEQHDASL